MCQREILILSHSPSTTMTRAKLLQTVKHNLFSNYFFIFFNSSNNKKFVIILYHFCQTLHADRLIRHHHVAGCHRNCVFLGCRIFLKPAGLCTLLLRWAVASQSAA